MDSQQIMSLLQGGGGFAVSGVFWYLWKMEREERQRYRDMHEQVLKDMPELTNSIKDLSNVILGNTSMHPKQ